MCFVSGEKVRPPVHFVTFPESAVWSPSLKESSLGLEAHITDSEVETIWRRVGGGSPVVEVGVVVRILGPGTVVGYG